MVPAGPPAAARVIPCRGPPPRGAYPAGMYMPPRGPAAAAAAAPVGTAGVETKSSRGGHRGDSGSSAGGRKLPLTARWPCPQAGPASLAHVLRGWLASLGVGASLSGSPFPTPSPPPGAGPAITRPRGRSEVPPTHTSSQQSAPPSHVRLGPERLERTRSRYFRDRDTETKGDGRVSRHRHL